MFLALAMGVQVVAHATPALRDMAACADVHFTDAAGLEDTFAKALDASDQRDPLQTPAREYFCTHLSLAACRPRLQPFLGPWHKEPEEAWSAQLLDGLEYLARKKG